MLKCSRNLYRYKKLFIPSSQPLTTNTKSSALDVAAVLDPPLVWLNKTRKGLDEDLENFQCKSDPQKASCQWKKNIMITCTKDISWFHF